MKPWAKEDETQRAGQERFGWMLSRRFIVSGWIVFGLLFLATLCAFIIFKNQTEARLSLLFAHRQDEIAAATAARLADAEFSLRAAREIEADAVRGRLAMDRGFPELRMTGLATQTGGGIALEGPAGVSAVLDIGHAPGLAPALRRDGGAGLALLPAAAAKAFGLPAGRYLVMLLAAPRLAAAHAAAPVFVFHIIDMQRFGDYVMSTLSWKDVRLVVTAPDDAGSGMLYDSDPAAGGTLPEVPDAGRDETVYGLPLHYAFHALPYFGHRLGEIEYVWLIMAGGFCGFAVIGFYLVVSGQLRSQNLGRDLDQSRLAVKRNRDLLQLFLKDAPVSVAMFDQNVRYLICSDRWKRDVGLPEEDLSGQCHYDLFPDYLAENPDARRRVQRILEGENISENKMRVTRRDGGWDYIRYEARPWRNERGVVEGIISFREVITDKVKAEEELRRYAQEVEQFAYIASHDLKAPLRGIDNLAKWIGEDMEAVMTPEVRESFGLLRSRVRRLETMLDDILRYSKAGHVVEPPQTVDTGELIDNITRLHPWGDSFCISCAGAMPVLHSPRTPLEQIFTNLIANGVKHHDRPEGRVTVQAVEHPTHWEFVIEDDGPGIPPEFHERVFGLFQTLKPRDQREGSGLGMSIIKKLVEWQGGKVWIVSEAGRRGTAVHFEWPKDFQRRISHAA